MSEVEIIEQPSPWPEIESSTIGPLAAHDSAWLNALQQGFGHRVFLLRCQRDGQTTGLLPLMLVKGPIFGSFLVSLPYLNTGGVWATDQAAAMELLDRACGLADELNVKYLECRHETAIPHPRFNFARTDKVHMRLQLPDSDEALMKSFKSKLRSQIKKAGQYDLQVRFGGTELLDDFYQVFARNMRDLGTPVFSRKLFAAILREFDGDAELCSVSKDGQTIASGLIIHRHGVTEVPSASSLREFNRLNANMLMYRHLLRRSIERGSNVFDFGRSSEDSGTYKFKAQWGATPSPANWQYYVRKGDPNDMRPDAGNKKRLVEIWQRLPVWLTKTIGPPIVRGIP